MRRPAGGRLLRLIGVSVLVGLIVTGLALPVVAGTGLLARASADSIAALPTDLQAMPLSQRSRLLAADGSELATIFLDENRIVAPLAEIPVQTRQALVAIEDSRFYEHRGIDYKGLLRALATNSKAGEVRQGGSTLTQQYVKNALVEQARTKQAKREATAQTATRKIREARYAVALEQRLSKDEILERYLNIAYFANGVYGVGTAAWQYFDKPVSQLTLPESALLAGLVKNPTLYDPVRQPEEAKARRNVVLARMAEVGFLSPAEAQAAMVTPVRLSITPTRGGCEASSAPFFCAWVISEAQNDPALGATREERTARLFQGGLTIRTTLDPQAQRATQAAVDGTVPRDSRVATAAILVEPGTGKVRAMAVNRDYGTDATKNETTNNFATGGSSGFQAGSTFKVFVLAAAIRQGIPLSLSLDSPQTYRSSVFSEQGAPYTVSNAGDSESGVFDLTTATAQSVNTYFLQLEERTGLDAPASLAEAMGVRLLPGNEPLRRVPSFTLGTNEVSPLAMAEAYATFAARGRYCRPLAVEALTDAKGARLASPPPSCRQVLEPVVADTVTAVLRQVIDGDDPQRTGQRATIGRPAAGKTGTVEGFGAAWFAGYTPDLAAAVWMGDPAGGFANPLTNVTIGGTGYRQVYGGDVPAAIFGAAVGGALDGSPVRGFSPAADVPTRPAGRSPTPAADEQ